jgi:hypothetical protein
VGHARLVGKRVLTLLLSSCNNLRNLWRRLDPHHIDMDSRRVKVAMIDELLRVAT